MAGKQDPGVLSQQLSQFPRWSALEFHRVAVFNSGGRLWCGLLPRCCQEQELLGVPDPPTPPRGFWPWGQGVAVGHPGTGDQLEWGSVPQVALTLRASWSEPQWEGRGVWRETRLRDPRGLHPDTSPAPSQLTAPSALHGCTAPHRPHTTGPRPASSAPGRREPDVGRLGASPRVTRLTRGMGAGLEPQCPGLPGIQLLLHFLWS